MKRLLLLCLVFLSVPGFAQNPSDRDPGYNPSYNLPLNYHLIPVEVNQFGCQSDGRILYVENSNKLVRLQDNLLDTGFNVVVTGGISDFCVMPDDKIVVVGNFTQCNGVAKRSIVRLNADGTIDESFVVGSGYPNSIFAVEPSNTGGVVFYGNASTYNGIPWTKSMVRLSGNGTLDQTFDYPDTSGSRLFHVQPDGKILLLTTNGDLVRHFPNGSYDFSFSGSSNSPENYISDFILEPDGKVTIAGYFESFNGLPQTGVIRLLSNGQPDPTFSAPAFYCPTNDGKVTGIARQVDGKYVVCGKFTTIAGVTHRHIAQLNVDGTQNPLAFTGYTEIADYNNFILHQMQSGKIIFGGFTNQNRLHYQGQLMTNVLRTNADGTIDPTLANHTKGFYPNGPVSVTQRIDGKLLCAATGAAYTNNTFNDYEFGAIVQLNEDYTIDETFNQTIKANLGGIYPEYDNTYVITKVKALNDGKIILQGGFKYTYAGVEYFNFVLLNPDGSVAFGLGNWQAQAADFDIDPATGKILITGNGPYMSTYNFPGNGVIRLLPSGVQDAFSLSYSGTITDKIIIRQLPTGKIALVGNNNKRLFIFNNNGTYVSSFPTNIVWVNDLEVGSNGNMYFYDGNSGLKKISESGVYDTSFENNIDLGGITCFDLQPDGKIVIAGVQMDYTGVIIRTFADGTTDTSFELKEFDTGGQFIQNLRYGKIFVAGQFDYYDGAVNNKTVLLLGQDYYYLVGQNKLDNDLNGCSPSDIDFPFLKYAISNGSTTMHHIANYTGGYAIGMTEGSYTVTPQMENPDYFTINPSSVNVTFPAANNPQQQDFCVAPNGSHQDVEVILVPINIARPGFVSQYKVIYKNKGNIIVSGQVSLTFQNTVLSLNTTLPAAAVSGNQLTWDYANLWPFETREIDVTFALNTPIDTPSLNGGDVLALSAIVSPNAEDEQLADNTFNLNQEVVNSYDPNDKTCLEGAVVTEDYIGEYVHYMIRFENTGTGDAINIIVNDNIDPEKFEIGSLTPLSGSHPFYTRIEGDKASFVFENINLPFADDQNDGYVVFKIRLKNDLEPGDLFTNQAEINFDFNYPIVTNMSATTIQLPLSVGAEQASAFSVYPNPAADFCMIVSNEQIVKVDIISADGRLIRTVRNPSENRLDTSALTPGYYLLRLEGVTNTEVLKLIKE